MFKIAGSKCNLHIYKKTSHQQIAVWIDEILSESDERLLMMDFDEDDG